MVASKLCSVELAASPKASRAWLRLSDPVTWDSRARADARPKGENKMLCCIWTPGVELALVARSRGLLKTFSDSGRTDSSAWTPVNNAIIVKRYRTDIIASSLAILPRP
ncbi:hypothetical protein CgunFtcFv8_007625 [Champsocephalus gunnari]|uniref:Uncharacterized protein n=1 Tax=Champsocephalus gunnari TaxID=52237 RepID=A0AAN8CHF9_CHAGU|nr:hypothetical protein CgunFtcFv8_007625 [Champsocephalus gunnari]